MRWSTELLRTATDKIIWGVSSLHCVVTDTATFKGGRGGQQSALCCYRYSNIQGGGGGGQQSAMWSTDLLQTARDKRSGRGRRKKAVCTVLLQIPQDSKGEGRGGGRGVSSLHCGVQIWYIQQQTKVGVGGGGGGISSLQCGVLNCYVQQDKCWAWRGWGVSSLHCVVTDTATFKRGGGGSAVCNVEYKSVTDSKRQKVREG